MAKIQHASSLKVVGDPDNPRPFGGLQLLTSLGDCHQLPPCAAKAHFDKGPASKPNHLACTAGMIQFDEFRNPTHPDCKGATVVMDSVYRQDDDEFKTQLEKMRDGGMDDPAIDYFLLRAMSMLPPEERELFEKEGLYVVPTWKRTQKITYDYLLSLNQPIAKVQAKYGANPRGTNHAKKEINLPVQNALCSDAKVMLLHNFLVELGLMNGSVGYLKYIVYEDSAGPRADGNPQPLYVVVDFPDSLIPPEDAWDRAHPTWIPIPVVTRRCENNCCSMTTIPLRVCKAITYYKCQGMTIGPGCIWTHVVVGMPWQNERSAPGGELVAFSRAATRESFAILEDEPLTRETFAKIGQGPSYQAKRDFEQSLRDSEEESQRWILGQITAMDQSTDVPDERTFEGGYQYLVSWFRERVPAPDVQAP